MHSRRWPSLLAALTLLISALPPTVSLVDAQAPAEPPATLRLARLFGDGMVLQRDTRIPVWGWAAPGTRVSATLHGRSARATADSVGAWRVVFPALPAGGPYVLTVAGAGRRIAVHDVLVGDVWVASGPTYRRHVVRDGRMIIAFDHVGGGLVSHGASGARDTVTGFAIAGEDRRFVWAQARIEGDHVIVWSDRVPRPVAVRYAWSNSPRNPNLYNREGLPATPFRTDHW